MASPYDALLEAPTSPYDALLTSAQDAPTEAPPVSPERRADVQQFVDEHGPIRGTDESILELANKPAAWTQDNSALDWLEQQTGAAHIIDTLTGTKTAGEAAVGINKGVRHLAEGLTSPLGIATLGLGGAPKIIQTLVGSAFALNMVKHLPEQIKSIGEAKTPEERAQRITEAIGAGAMLFGLGKHIAGRKSGGNIAEMERQAVASGEAIAPLTTAAVDATKPHEQSIPDSAGSRQEGDAQRQTGHRGERGLRTGEGLPTDERNSPELQQTALGGEPGSGVAAAEPAESALLAPETVKAAQQVGLAPKDLVVTSTKNVVVDTERTARGQEPLQAGAHVSDATTWEQAGQRLEQHPTAGADLVKELNANPRPITNVENDILLRHKIAVHAEGRRIIEEANREGITKAERTAAQTQLELNDQAVDAIDTALKKGGTETGRALAARRKMADEDYNLVAMRAKMRAVKGEALTPAEETKAKDIAEKIEETSKTGDAKSEEAQQARAEDSFDRLLKTLREESQASAKKGGGVVEFLHEQAEKARARIKARGVRLNAGLNPAELADHVIIGAEHIANGIVKLKAFTAKMIAEFGEAIRPFVPDLFEKSKAYHDAASKLHEEPSAAQITAEIPAGSKLDHRTVFEIARAHVRAGMSDLGEVMKAVAADLQGVHEGITEREVRDAFSDYGKVKLPNPAVDAKTLRDLRAQGQLASALEDATAGEAPKKSGTQRDKPSQKVRELRRKVVAKMKEMGIPTGDPATKLSTAQAARKTALENQIADLQKAIETNERIVHSKGATELDAEGKALRDKRDALKEQYERQFPKEPLSDEQLLARYKTAISARTKELQRRLAESDFSKSSKRVLQLDREAEQAKAENARAKLDYLRAVEKLRLANRTQSQKFWDRFVGIQRAMKLSSDVVLAKLSLAAVAREVLTPVEESVGAGISKVLPGLAERAPREGGLSLRAEAKAKTAIFTSGMRDAWQNLKMRESDLEATQGKPRRSEPEWYEYFGFLHGALKAPIKRAEFVRSLEKRMEHALRTGIDVTDPNTMVRLAQESYIDANRSIFMQDNVVSQGFNGFVSIMEKSKSAPTLGPVGARLARFFVPIVKVPTNIVGEVATSAGGLPVGAARAVRAYWKGIQDLPAEQADSILRQLKKGAVGASLMLYGYYNYKNVGGFYYDRDHRDKGDVKVGHYRVGGVDMPSSFSHSHAAMLLNVGATLHRVQEERGTGKGLRAAASGVVEQLPFVPAVSGLLGAMHDEAGFERYLNTLITSTTTPALLQHAAKVIDTPGSFPQNAFDEAVKRKPKTMLDAVKMGVPGLRQDVPEKE